MGDFGIYYLLETNTRGVSKWPVARRNDCGLQTDNLKFRGSGWRHSVLLSQRDGDRLPARWDKRNISGHRQAVGYRETTDLLESSALRLTGKFTDFRYLFTYDLHTAE